MNEGCIKFVKVLPRQKNPGDAPDRSIGRVVALATFGGYIFVIFGEIFKLGRRPNIARPKQIFADI